MKRRACVAAAAMVAAPWPVITRGQRARRIGVLYSSLDPGKPPPGADTQWRKVESVLGETVRIERRYAAWRLERLPELADDLLRRGNAEVLWAFGHPAAVAAARATRTVPIVFSWVYLPVEAGLVSSLAKPGGNITGYAWTDGQESTLKVFDFVRAAAPSARRWGTLIGDFNTLPAVSGDPLRDLWPRVDAAARARGFERTTYAAPRFEDLDATLEKAAAARLDAVMVVGESGYDDVAARLAEFALRQRWITATSSPPLFSAGLLIYHGPTGDEYGRLHVRNVDIITRILKGANPADFPVELPARVELAINLTTAQKLGITLPQSLLLQADRVVQ